MQVKILNPIEYPKWDRQLQAFDGATIFHTAKWANVLSETYRYYPRYISGIKDADLVGVLPIMDIKSALTGRRGVSLPFTDQCKAVCSHQEVFEALWKEAVSYGRKAGWKYIELRESNPVNNSGCSYDRYFVHSLNIDGDEKTILKKFRSSTKRNIRKAQNSGVKTRISRSYSDMFIFYKLNCITRKEHGLPPQPLLFFKKLFQYLIDQGMGFIVIAELKDQPIAGAVFLAYGKQGIYKYGASDKRYQSLRANNLVMWTAIKEFMENGYRAFHFGRTEPHHEGLLQFKRGWGAEESELYYYRYDILHNRFVMSARAPKSSYSLFSHMPIPALKILGQLLYRHVG